MDIREFLTARLDEDEATARAAADLGIGTFGHWIHRTGTGVVALPYALGVVPDTSETIGAHIVRWDPARVLAEIDAKRGRVAEFRTWDAKLKQVGERPDTFSAGNRGEIQGMWMMARRAILRDATVYAEHPDYQPGWRVE